MRCVGDQACENAYLSKCGLQCELNCLCQANCIEEKSCGDDYTKLINEGSTFIDCIGLFCITPNPTQSPVTTMPTLSPSMKPSDSPIAEGDPTRAPSAGTPSPSITPTIDPTPTPSSVTWTPSESPTLTI